MKMNLLFAAAAVLTLAAAASAKEKNLKLKDLPEAVRSTVIAQSKDGKLLGLTSEKEGGKTTYEAVLQIGERHVDVSIDQAGAVLETEERMDFSTLPAAVKAGLQKGAGKGKIGEVEAISKGGAVAMYEAQVRTGRKKSEVKVAPDGTAIPK
jgi:hypothetical protein